MPTEQEELRLTVTLADNASAGLEKLRAQLKDLGGGGEGQRHVERIGRDTAELEKKFKFFGGTINDTFKALGSLRTSYVAGAGAIGIFSKELIDGIKAVGDYSDKLRNMAQLGQKIGVDPGVIRNISDQLKIFGVSAEQSQASLAKFAQGMAALQRDPTVRAGILRDTAPGAVANMNQLIDRLNAAKGIEEKAEIARQAVENVKRNALKRGESEERAADEARTFGQRLSYDLELSYAGKLKERTAEEKKADEERIENAKKYSAELAKVYQKWDDIKNLMMDPQMGEGSTFFLTIKAANFLLEKTIEAIKWLRAPPEPLTPKEQEQKQQFDKGRLQDENRRRELLGLPPRTMEDQKKSTDENTEQMKKLTDLLQLQSNIQLASMQGGAGGGGFQNAAFTTTGRAPGAAGFGGGGYANLGTGGGEPGAGTVPRSLGGGGGGGGGGGVDTGAARTPRMTQSKREVAQAAAASLRAGGMSENMIAGIFANIADESAFNPNLRHPDQPKFSGEAHFAHGLYQEGGTEWNNYAAWIAKNHPEGNWRDPKLQSDFLAHRMKTGYPKTWAKMQAAKTPGEAAAIFVNEYLKPAAQHRSSRMGKYLRGVPGVESYTGKDKEAGVPTPEPQVPTAEPQQPPRTRSLTDDDNIRMDDQGGGTFGQHNLLPEQLRKRGERSLMNQPGGLTRDNMLDAYRRRLDADGSTTKVEGSGKITVDVNAPKGTNVGAEGGGLFKDVEINRQTQMLPADIGPGPYP